MKKIKLENRIENAVNAFFEDENLHENTQLSYFADTALLANEQPKSFTQKADSVITTLKYIFFFLPGSFALYFFTLLVAYFPLGEASAGMLLAMALYLGAGSFMTLVGIGSVKEVKNLVVPFSIMFFATIFATIVSLLPLPTEIKEHICFYYSALLFPVALIIANLAKNWVNEK
jgi:hypothetical protein